MQKIIFFIFFLVSIPVVVINFFYSVEIKNVVSGFINNKVDNSVQIRVLCSENEVISLDLEEYIIGVVAGEMPLSFEEEALKAQAVASRTYALKQMEQNKDNDYDVTDNTLSQVYISKDILMSKWENNYEDNYNKLKKIINDTKGEYVSYNDEIIYAFFFSTSNGYTEDNKNVFGKDLPYLKIVDSSFDKNETSSFETTVSFSKEDFYNKLSLDYSEVLTITDIVKSESNRTLSLYINDKYFKGRDFQKLLSLKSNDFSITENEDNIVITTKGFGHGVGMSQYGANALAKQNKTYQEILKYYYSGTEIKKL